MSNLDPAVKKETGYIAAWVGILSLGMEAVFLLLRQWDGSVLLGNLGGAAAGGTVDDIAPDALAAAERAVPISHDELSHSVLLNI